MIDGCSLRTIICPWSNDWYEYFRLGGYEIIEWLEIKIENNPIRKDILDILRKINVPGEILESSIKIYGYVKTGTYVKYI
ncbi:DUF6678 family protein [Peribacillus sp. FSL K6-1552]|uniref:DUF6678 family protein n=1 Tax=Peribacillus sp. FSL K6-1552 TaxID=2954514 RepID=UPI0030FCBE44